MKVITFFRVNFLKTIRQYRVVLSIDVDYLEMLVEGQIQPICQFHFVFILVHFNGQKVMLATIESGVINKSYDVVLQNGTKLEFDKKGNLTEIDCKLGIGKLVGLIR